MRGNATFMLVPLNEQQAEISVATLNIWADKYPILSCAVWEEEDTWQATES